MEWALWHIQKGREHVHTAQTYFKLIKLQYEAWGENCERNERKDGILKGIQWKVLAVINN